MEYTDIAIESSVCKLFQRVNCLFLLILTINLQYENIKYLLSCALHAYIVDPLCAVIN